MFCSKYFYIFLVLPFVLSQTVIDYQNSINNLYENYLNYKQPTSYADFYNNENLYSYGSVNNRCAVRRGRVLGGSSAINFNTYVRGYPQECDILSQQGLDLWNASVCLHYYLKSENATTKTATATWVDNGDNGNKEVVQFYQLDPGYHNTSGLLHTEPVEHFDVLGNALMNAAIELKRNILDYNGISQMGYGMLQSSTNTGKRISGSKAYLNPYINRTNLVVVTDAFVTRLTLSAGTQIVNGINFVLGNSTYTALATKEVILCAEAIRSPQILMNSGIGPALELLNLNITVIKNLPVGKNLVSYPLIVLPLELKQTIMLPNMTNIIQDYLNGYGVLTTSRNFQAMGSINTANASANDPNIRQWFGMPYFGQDYGYNVNYFNFTNETYNAYFGPVTNEKIAGFNIILIQPKSRGQITLRSNNPFDFPNIDLNYFDNPADVNAMVAGIKDAFTILSTNTMKQYGISLPTNPLPACNQFSYNSDAYLKCMVQQVTMSSTYLMGTNKMGLENDTQTVVDQTFKVIGFPNLRVVDDSVIPYTFTGYTNTLETMYGERAADMIISDHTES